MTPRPASHAQAGPHAGHLAAVTIQGLSASMPARHCHPANVTEPSVEGLRRTATSCTASVAGQFVAVESGLAVAALTLCSVPSHLQVLDERHGLPPLPAVELVLLRSKASARSAAVDAIWEELVHTAGGAASLRSCIGAKRTNVQASRLAGLQDLSFTAARPRGTET
jgi:hypothetical protein